MSVLKRKNMCLPSISLFTGAGGLDLGLEQAGFDVRLCVELDDACRKTLVANRPDWLLANPGDIHLLSPAAALEQAALKPGEAVLLAGGPPCQPFSKAAYWAHGETARTRDPRARTLSAYLSFVKYALPEVLLLENVRGLAYAGKDDGLQLLRKGLAEINEEEGTRYDPVVLHLNAASFGVPQLRERVFVVAHRNGTTIEAPEQTHFSAHQRLETSEGRARPYATAWDAIGDLDSATWDENLAPTGKWADLLPSVPEGENYLWHTPRGRGKPLFGWRTRYWSFLLKLSKGAPSWTIPAQPGPATGPFHWRNRRLSVRELCRLQTFPDDYEIVGSYRDAHRQIGNAVPPALGELLGREIRRQLLGEEQAALPLQLIPTARAGCPPPEPVASVQEKYLALCAGHEDHPGPGMGPGARRRSQATA